MLLATFLAAALLQADAPSLRPTELTGRCTYGETVARYRDEAYMVLCDTLRIDTVDGQTVLDFRQRSWGSMLRVDATSSEHGLAIGQVRVPRHAPYQAKGSCEVLRQDGDISSVTCIARSGGRTFVANFIRGR